MMYFMRRIKQTDRHAFTTNLYHRLSFSSKQLVEGLWYVRSY